MKYFVTFNVDAGTYLAHVEASSVGEFNELFADLLRRRFGQFESPRLLANNTWESVPENMEMLKLQKENDSAVLIAVRN